MPESPYKPIEQLLKDRIGLDPVSLGAKAVEHAALERMRLLGHGDIPNYLALLSASPVEMEALIELVVIPETWFFRDREPFVFLADFLRSTWIPSRAADMLRILSAPCATGEEPYSIAMTCLDCGLTRKQFTVDAIDISEKFLAKAKEAIFGRNSFRGANLNFRERYFNQDGHAYTLKPEVRECVRFCKANLIESGGFFHSASYNIIFYRNLMIYFHDQARTKTITAIDRILANDGLLFVGHAETIPALMETFESVSHNGAFALRRRPQKETNQHQVAPAQKRHLPLPAFHFAVVPAGHETSKSRTTAAVEPGSLENATRLADIGRLKEAAVACAHALKTEAANPRAHFLMGLIREAEGDNRGAEECFNRAIYLDADFTEAIIHLAVLREENGDSASAEHLRRRAGSIKNKSA
jgi:chemotaxis protein methyltransferase WspC